MGTGALALSLALMFIESHRSLKNAQILMNFVCAFFLFFLFFFVLIKIEIRDRTKQMTDNAP